MTVKRKIVLWYTLWIFLMLIVLGASLIAGGGILSDRNAREAVNDAVSDILDDVEVRRGRLTVDESDFYDDGVFVSIYDDEGNIMSGHLPQEVSSIPLENSGIRIVSGWYILDVEAERDGIVFTVRGAFQSSGRLKSGMILLLFSMPLAALLASLGGAFIVYRSFRPVDEMISECEKIASGDDLSKRITPENASGEIYQLGHSFDSILSRLESSFEKERQFTSDASHELRTPVSVILAECGYASSHTAEKDEMENVIKVITEQGERMASLLSSLLLLSRADDGRVVLNKEQVDLFELSSIVMETLKDEADEKNITLSVEGDRTELEADRDMMIRMLINLVSNSIRYGRNGGFVKIRIEGSSISVIDNGIGIPAESLPLIWNRFYQVDRSRSNRDSAGLGLSIVRWIAEAHGGTISAESVPGEGTKITVRFPS